MAIQLKAADDSSVLRDETTQAVIRVFVDENLNGVRDAGEEPGYDAEVHILNYPAARRIAGAAA